MSAFEAYKDYVALKNHFTKPNYDYVKYNGKTGLKIQSFEKRKDKLFFEKLAKNKDYHNFLIANLSDNPKLWIRDLAYSDKAQQTYIDWQKRQQSLTYNFKSHLKKIVEEPKDGHHPAAIRLFLANEISLESLCIFAAMTNAVKKWDKRFEYDPIWDELRNRIVKYTPFIKYEKSNVAKIILDIIGDQGYTK